MMSSRERQNGNTTLKTSQISSELESPGLNKDETAACNSFCVTFVKELKGIGIYGEIDQAVCDA